MSNRQEYTADDQERRITAFLEDLTALTEKHRISIHHDCSHDCFALAPTDRTPENPDGDWYLFATVEWDAARRAYRAWG